LTSILICGGQPLDGVVKISGSKNAALPCLAASLLTSETVALKNVPNIRDTKCMIDILRLLNCKVNVTTDLVTINAGCPDFVIPPHLSKLMRGSTLLLSSLLARCGRVRIGKYGGCPIGKRFIDVHLYAFKCLGATIEKKGSFTEISADELIGKEISLSFPSVGATENAVIAACVAKGETLLKNVAIEPEILNLIEMLQLMGADITVNTIKRTIKIVGTKELGNVKHELIPDRVEAGTYAVAAVLAGHRVLLQNLDVTYIRAITQKLVEIGANVEPKSKNSLQIFPTTCSLRNVKIVTAPYPAFPTDMQPQFTVLCTQASGVSCIFEALYENRFNHIPELKKMGANVDVHKQNITVNGPTSLHGETVQAVDLRGGAALVIAGLVADGLTTVNGAEVIERGYEHIETKLRKLGAQIEFVNNY
jgi:UDP-N-acetylglucosamine 1-carboxyvinyltransferase